MAELGYVGSENGLKYLYDIYSILKIDSSNKILGLRYRLLATLCGYNDVSHVPTYFATICTTFYNNNDVMDIQKLTSVLIVLEKR